MRVLLILIARTLLTQPPSVQQRDIQATTLVGIFKPKPIGLMKEI